MTGWLIGCAVAAVLIVFTYTLGMFLEGMGRPERPAGPVPAGLRVVFLVPCLNEGQVVGGALRDLTEVARPQDLIVVIDDGSDDGTAEAIRGVPDPRVRRLRRDPPHARQGKGAALNHAIRALPALLLGGGDPSRTIVCLMDADGRLDSTALGTVLPEFATTEVCAVQITVRISNRADSVLARLQDMEFVLYSRIFQRTRGRLGFAGLGGNGQFVRLSALEALGDEPWTDGLTEDLELGIRLALTGGRVLFLPHTAVRQQGLVRADRLVRQRSRWFQGHLQAWRLIPAVVRRSTGRAAADLLHVLLSPLLVFVGSFMTVSLLASVVGAALSDTAREQLLRPVPLMSWYLLTFAPAYLFGPLYARATGEIRAVRGLLYGHLFVVYALLWLVAGWWGLGRALAGRRSWLKTERLSDAESTSPTTVGPAGSAGSVGSAVAPGRHEGVRERAQDGAP